MAETSLVELRRIFHAHPELGFTEIETASTVVRMLSPVADSTALGRDVSQHSAKAGLPTPDELEGARRRALDHGTPSELVDVLGTGHTGVVVTINDDRSGPVQSAPPIPGCDLTRPSNGRYRAGPRSTPRACSCAAPQPDDADPFQRWPQRGRATSRKGTVAWPRSCSSSTHQGVRGQRPGPANRCPPRPRHPVGS